MSDLWKSLPMWAKWTVGVVARLVVIGAGGDGEEKKDEGSDEAEVTLTEEARRTETEKAKPAEPVDTGRMSGELGRQPEVIHRGARSPVSRRV